MQAGSGAKCTIFFFWSRYREVDVLTNFCLYDSSVLRFANRVGQWANYIRRRIGDSVCTYVIRKPSSLQMTQVPIVTKEKKKNANARKKLRAHLVNCLAKLFSSSIRMYSSELCISPRRTILPQVWCTYVNFSNFLASWLSLLVQSFVSLSSNEWHFECSRLTLH